MPRRKTTKQPELSAENRATLDRLTRSLDMAEGFALFFARCNVPALQEQLVATATQTLMANGVHVLELAAEPNTMNLRSQLRAKLTIPAEKPAPRRGKKPVLQPGLALAEPKAAYIAMPKRVVFITGLQNSIPLLDPNARLLAELNLGRDAFRRDAPVPLVFWLPDYAVTAVAQHAPDFWAWRSGLFEFVSEEKSPQST